MPEVARLAEEVRTTRTPRVLRQHNEDVAVLSPVTPGAPKRRTRDRRLTKDDPLFDLVGIGHSGGPGDVSANKQRYLAEAYLAEASGDPTP